jgi:hypothetical protein
MRPFLILVVLFAACSFHREVKLEGPPVVPRAECIVVEAFTDARDEARLGVARNGFGMIIGEAATPDDLAAWTQDVFQRVFPPGASCGEPLRLTGVVRRAFVEEFWNLDADVVVTLKLSRGTQVVLERDFRGRYQKVSNLGSAEEFSSTLRDALGALVHDAVSVVIEAAKPPALP